MNGTLIPEDWAPSPENIARLPEAVRAWARPGGMNDEVRKVAAEMLTTTIYTNQHGQDAIRAWADRLAAVDSPTMPDADRPMPDWKYWYGKTILWMERAKRLGYVPPGEDAAEATRLESAGGGEGVPVAWQYRSGGRWVSLSSQPDIDKAQRLVREGLMPAADLRALYARPQAAQGVPDGWKLVPVVPTPEILAAYAIHFRKVFPNDGIRTIYGMTGAESLPVLDKAISELGNDVDPDYWKATEGNAKQALTQLRALAAMRPDGVWQGD